MKQRIIIVGPGGSGKTTLAKRFQEKGYKLGISATTRPKREDEIEGIDYFYFSEKIFLSREKANWFQETDEFNGWKYGTSFSEWNLNDIFIKTPRGVSKISEEDRKNCLVVYLDVPLLIRYKRLSERSDADIVGRRISADEIDFKDFTNYDIRITNPDF